MKSALFAVRATLDDAASWAVEHQQVARVFPSLDEAWVMVQVPVDEDHVLTAGPQWSVEDVVASLSCLQIPVFATDGRADYVAWSSGSVEQFDDGVHHLPFWCVDVVPPEGQPSHAVAVVAKHEIPDLVLSATAIRRPFRWVSRGAFTVIVASDLRATDRAMASTSSQRRCAALRIAVSGDEVDVVAVQDGRLVAQHRWNGAARVVGEQFAPADRREEANAVFAEPSAQAHQFAGLKGFYVDRGDLPAIDALLLRTGDRAELVRELVGYLHLPDPDLFVEHLLGTRSIEDASDIAVATPEASTVSAIRTAMRIEDQLGVGWQFTRGRKPWWDVILTVFFLPFLLAMGGFRFWQLLHGALPGGWGMTQLAVCAFSLPSCVAAARRLIARRRGQTV